MAHEKPENLKLLLQQLDYTEHAFFIHIDKKSKLTKELINSWKMKSPITFVENRNVIWGAYSQIEAEILLLEEAVKGNFNYYHLLSGIDFPIKSNEAMQAFLKKNDGKEFVQFQKEIINEKNLKRVKYYYFLQEYTGKKKNFFWAVQKISIILQKIIAIDRTKKSTYFKEFQMGANWFSITNELAHYVVQKKSEIEQTFKFTQNGDELFLQTIILNSPFRKSLYHLEFDNSTDSNLRYVSWENDTPKVLTEIDFQRLKSGNEFFARKFDDQISKALLNKIKKLIN
ncbi:beta-1,6-N-acetylglucosaminyltransferase [Enterococcus sp. ALS3]|uniref:Peptide O-xylosyltransferase n=2 Tax=Enterococcus TaxID=1350 RepID=A0ABS6TAE0_9ENTE|nr:beta-1,6-N-acetylglucosaminyltransferase [Enterococcus alishanensis]